MHVICEIVAYVFRLNPVKVYTSMTVFNAKDVDG